MKTKDLMIVGLAGVAVYLILKNGGAFAARSTATKPLTVWYGSYNYAGDEAGNLYSATGADVRARR